MADAYVRRSSLVEIRDWRWCEAKDAPEVWEDGNGCLWCTGDDDHPRLFLDQRGRQVTRDDWPPPAIAKWCEGRWVSAKALVAELRYWADRVERHEEGATK